MASTGNFFAGRKFSAAVGRFSERALAAVTKLSFFGYLLFEGNPDIPPPYLNARPVKTQAAPF
jgi:hypothetical protein